MNYDVYNIFDIIFNFHEQGILLNKNTTTIETETHRNEERSLMSKKNYIETLNIKPPCRNILRNTEKSNKTGFKPPTYTVSVAVGGKLVQSFTISVI